MGKCIMHKNIDFPLSDDEEKYTIKCKTCGKLYKSENSTMVWEIRKDRWEGLCYDCYKKDFNTNFSEQDAIECAEWSISHPDFSTSGFLVHPDLSFDKHMEFVVPEIRKLLKKKEQERKEKHRQEIVEKAVKIYQDAQDELLDPKYHYYNSRAALTIKIIAELLERIESLEEKLNKPNLYS